MVAGTAAAVAVAAAAGGGQQSHQAGWLEQNLDFLGPQQILLTDRSTLNSVKKVFKSLLTLLNKLE